MALTVLIADDEPDMRLYLSTCLHGMGPAIGQVLEATDGQEAMSIIQSGLVDVVVCDVIMPRLDGYGLCRAVRNDPELRDIPILLVSGEEPGSASALANGFLPKPFNAGQLEAALFRLFPQLKLEAR